MTSSVHIIGKQKLDISLSSRFMHVGTMTTGMRITAQSLLCKYVDVCTCYKPACACHAVYHLFLQSEAYYSSKVSRVYVGSL